MKLQLKYLLGFLGEENANNHEIRKRQEKVGVRVILVLFHKECCSAAKQNNYIITHFSFHK